MNDRVRGSALFLSVLVFGAGAPALAQSAAPADAPPPAGDLAAPPAPAPTITTTTTTPADPAYPPATGTTAGTTTTTTTTTMGAPAPVAAPPTKLAPVQIASPSTTIKFGLLAQPQYEAAGNFSQDGLSQNLYLRRARVLIGGSLFGVIDYFFDTEFANLFKASPVAGAMGAPATTGPKATPGMNIQDIFVTYKPVGDVFKVDVGYMLPPLSHNAVQGAGSLYGWDYFAYSFQHSNAFNASAPPVGRDAGVQVRGLVLDGHLEYRAGLFQGLRNQPSATDVGARNFFRATARLQVNLLDAEPGFFYSGTYFGAKKILSLGGSFDVQDDYYYWAVDGFADLPLGPGVLTAQVNFAQWNPSNTTFVAQADQMAVMGEIGFTTPIFDLSVSPIVRYEQLWTADDSIAVGFQEKRIGGGLAFWPYLHNSNLKAFYTRVLREGTDHGAHQVNLQWQVYFF